MSYSPLTNTPPPPPSPIDLPPLSPLTLSAPSFPTITQSQSLQIFHPFPRLPYELRLKIYAHIVAVPRIVSIAYITKAVTVKDDEDETVGTESGRGGGRRLFDSTRGGRTTGGGRGRWTQGPRFVSRWVSSEGTPAALGVCKELREQALKTYSPTFGSLESPPQIYFNYTSDTLYFGNASISFPHPFSHSSQKLISLPTNHLVEKTEPAPYRLDLFLGGDYYGVSSHDFKRIRYLALDVAEELYGRRSFCWEDIRGLTRLEYLLLVAWEEDEDERDSFGVTANGTVKDRCMRSYHNSLMRVWEKYAKGYGEGLGSEADLDGEENKWTIPKIEVWNACTGNYWGEVKLKSTTAITGSN